MKQTDLRDLLHRYQQGTCTPEEKQIVEDWYDVLGHEREINITRQEQETIKAALWARIAQDTFENYDTSLPAKASSWTVWRRPGRWAAAALVALGIGLGAQQVLTTRQSGPGLTATTVPTSRWVVHINRTNAPEQLALPDGSHVLLSPRSQLKYPRAFTGGRRIVTLTGEAFFDVYHDASRPFLVYTQKVVTRVLGTSFLVQAPVSAQPVVVQVKTGRVRVTPRATAEAGATATLPGSVVVLPNQQAVYKPDEHALKRELVAQPVQLVAQSFAFDDRPVTEVLAALEKAYGVVIEYDANSLASCTVTLNLRDESLYGKLNVLSKALGASYSTADTHILFRSPGCATR
ncbi:FecR family protein [Hymenobacter mucosus]|uniref:FecR family protein n=1 Tax=Hymenobacter mucosus TaxID=1411120 RepID=A0A238XIQ2_9BACT|nr:FecR domain-containing protein [Hymenobacter mucosus]SNR58886.1 FecR family protein [Hymenobacter mucosus]